MWLLLKDLTNDEVDELQKATAIGSENELKLDYVEKWGKYASKASKKTIAVRQIKYDK